MNIFVCIKQVPATNRVQVDEETGVLIRDGVLSKMNPYDLYALETALRLRDTCGGSVTVGTMGPPQAEGVLREAFAMGADEAFLFTDRRLGGADVLATSYTLAQAIRACGDYDLILCGKQTTDGDTAQVGPAIAEHLGVPHAAWVSGIAVRDGGIEAVQQLQDVIETAWLPLPCLITVEQDIYAPRLPSLVRARETRGRAIHVRTLDDFLDTDPDHYGLTGSPTQVERIFPPTRDVDRETWTGASGGERLYERLLQWKVIEKGGISHGADRDT